MRSYPPLLLSSLLCALVSVSFAATETTNINLQVIHNEYVQLAGSAVGAERHFSVDDINPPGSFRPWLSLGKIGIASNVAGDCTINFSTLNTFEFKHTVSNKRLSQYKLFYKGKTIRNNKNMTRTLPCTSPPLELMFKSVGTFKHQIESGIYSDTITITVTTQ